MRVLVTGATEYVGGRLVPKLLESDHDVRVLVRDLRRIERRPWREQVEAVEPGRLLRLHAEMRLPGEAWLQWETVPLDGGTQLVQTAIFLPIGLAGTLYWWFLFPAHAVMFGRPARAVARLGERETDA